MSDALSSVSTHAIQNNQEAIFNDQSPSNDGGALAEQMLTYLQQNPTVAQHMRAILNMHNSINDNQEAPGQREYDNHHSHYDEYEPEQFSQAPDTEEPAVAQPRAASPAHPELAVSQLQAPLTSQASAAPNPPRGVNQGLAELAQGLVGWATRTAPRRVTALRMITGGGVASIWGGSVGLGAAGSAISFFNLAGPSVSQPLGFGLMAAGTALTFTLPLATVVCQQIWSGLRQAESNEPAPPPV